MILPLLSGSDHERISDAMGIVEWLTTNVLAFLSGFSGWQAYGLVFLVLLLCGLGLPIPEDITLISAGFIAYKGGADVFVMILVAMFGVLLGDSIIFYLGAHFGRKLLRHKFFRKLIHAERLNRVTRMLNERGTKLIFAARFMPGLRAPVYFTCGTLHVPYRTFLYYDGLAALISVPLIVYVTYLFGSELEWLIQKIQEVEYMVFGLVLVVIGYFVYKHYKEKRAQRRLESERSVKHSSDRT